MTANTKYTFEQSRLLQNSRCLSVGSDSLYLQLKPTIRAQSYRRKHTNCTTALQERYFPTQLRHGMQKTAIVLKLSNVTFAELFTSTAKI